MEATSASGTTRILIANGHACCRAGLRVLLEAVPDFAVVGEASDGGAVVKLARQLEPDVVLLDLVMPVLDSLSVLKELSTSPAQSRVILMAPAIDGTDLAKGLELGARGVLVKPPPADLLVKCIRSVMCGHYWVSHEQTKQLVGILAQPQAQRFEAAHGHDGHKRPFNLSPRELGVLKLVVGAFSNKEIAKTLSLSEETVKHHVHNIFEKTGASNRLELALFAVHHRLVEP